jgi:hypothetical protein
MDDKMDLEQIERQRAALLEQAAGIVKAAEAAGRAVSAEEDGRVLALMASVRSLEEQLMQLKRNHHRDVQIADRSGPSTY